MLINRFLYFFNDQREKENVFIVDHSNNDNTKIKDNKLCIFKKLTKKEKWKCKLRGEKKKSLKVGEKPLNNVKIAKKLKTLKKSTCFKCEIKEH